MARYYSNVSKLMALTVPMNNSVTLMTVDDSSGLPTSFPFNVVADADTSSVEVMSVTAAAGNVLTVVRGQQDTTAKAHALGAAVYHAWTAQDGTDAQNHFAATSGVHGAAGSVVGTTDTQTLTNKTISGSSNTLTNIPGSALASPLHNIAIDNTGSSGSDPLTVDPISGTTVATIKASVRNGGIALELIPNGSVSSGKYVDIHNGGTHYFIVDYAGNVTVAGGETVSGTSALQDVTAAQRQAGSPALNIAQSATHPTEPLVKLQADPGTNPGFTAAPALSIVVPDSDPLPNELLVQVVNETGSELLGVRRDGSLVAPGGAFSLTPLTVHGRLQVTGRTLTHDIEADSTITAQGVVSGTDFSFLPEIASLRDYFDALFDPPRLTISATGTTVADSTFTTVKPWTVVEERGLIIDSGVSDVADFQTSTTNGTFKAPQDGFHVIVGNLDLGTGSSGPDTDNRIYDLYVNVSGTRHKVNRDLMRFHEGSLNCSFNWAGKILTTDTVKVEVWENSGDTGVVLNSLAMSVWRVGPAA